MDGNSNHRNLQLETIVGPQDRGIAAPQTEVCLDRMNEICDRLDELNRLRKSKDAASVAGAS